MPLEKIGKRHVKIFKEDEITIEQSSEKKESGSYGEIVFGVISETGIPIALKRFKDDYSYQILDKDVIKEIILLQLFNQYPETNTVQFYGIYFSDNGKFCYLVLERLETTLHSISIRVKNDDTKNRGRLNSEQYKIIFYKLLKSINAIHSLGFLHNDIKLANIMLNGNDIKLIDFGLSKFIGLSPIVYQVSDYETTSVIQAPESRISFSTDIFSLASTMVHLCLRDYRNLSVLNNKFIIDTFDSTKLSFYLSMDRTFDVDGHDLLVKLLDSNPETRWCANKALLHPYFDSLRLSESVSIDRTVVGMQGGITGLNRHIEYTAKIYVEKSLELCYFEEMFNNYKNMICPIKHITTDINEYNDLMDWILEKFNSRNDITKMFYGIDTLINGIIMTNNDIDTYLITRKSPIQPPIHPNLIYSSFNIMMFYDITVNRHIHPYNILDGSVHFSEINSLFYNYLTDINIDFYPISIHISYIYLQLAHEIKTITTKDSVKTLQIDKKFFIDLCIQIIIWFIQPIPFQREITINDVVIFSTIKLLSKILSSIYVLLIKTPIIPILTMDLVKYEEMLLYYTVQYQSMEFNRYRSYNLYFNQDIFTP